MLPITISPTQHQATVYEVQRVEVPVSRQVGQEAGGGAVGLREEGLDMSTRVSGETSRHDQHRPVVITHHLDHLLLLLAGPGDAGEGQENGNLETSGEQIDVEVNKPPGQ